MLVNVLLMSEIPGNEVLQKNITNKIVSTTALTALNKIHWSVWHIPCNKRGQRMTSYKFQQQDNVLQICFWWTFYVLPTTTNRQLALHLQFTTYWRDASPVELLRENPFRIHSKCVDEADWDHDVLGNGPRVVSVSWQYIGRRYIWKLPGHRHDISCAVLQMNDKTSPVFLDDQSTNSCRLTNMTTLFNKQST